MICIGYSVPTTPIPRHQLIQDKKNRFLGAQCEPAIIGGDGEKIGYPDGVHVEGIDRVPAVDSDLRCQRSGHRPLLSSCSEKFASFVQ